MSFATASAADRQGLALREQRSTRLVFFAAGLAGAAWAALVPFTTLHAGISNGALGLLLLCLGAGSMVMMPLAGSMVAKLGCRLPISIALLASAAALPLLASLSRVPLLVAALLAFGAALGSVDVVMNVQAIIVERTSGRVMMSGFHGMFSLGGIAGAGGMTLLLSQGLGPVAAASIMSACLVGLLLAAWRHLLSHRSGREESAAFAFPHGIVLFIGAVCFVAFLAEGSVLDWSALFLTSARHLPAAYAGIGYAVFSTTMTIGRFTGDRVVGRFGGSNTVTASGLLAAAGFGTAALLPSWQAAALGYALVGAGCSNIVPVLFSAIGRQQVMPQNLAVSAMTTLGYAGILAGPAGIGFIAHWASLPAAFMLVSAMLVGVAISGRLLPR